MDGILIVDKPAGPTSHDVVDRVRRATGVRRIGHTGTLDPFATGVLPLVVGRATRLAQFLTATDKCYDATIRLGISTDTYDLTGHRIDEGRSSEPGEAGGRTPAVPDLETIDRTLASFVGSYEQEPPPFSAKKLAGVPSYVRARQGEPTQPKSVPVTVHALELVAVEGDMVSVRLSCSAGFYVRALAQALGERLGVGAHVQALRRTRSGGFSIEQAVPLEVVEREGPRAFDRLVPLADAAPHLPAVVLTREAIGRAVHGAILGPADLPGLQAARFVGPVRLLSDDGALVAIARPGPAPGTLHPFVVIR